MTVSHAARYGSLDNPATLREFVRNVREGIYITDAGGRLLDANAAFLEMFGIASVDELRSYRAADLHVDPARRQEEMELLSRDGAIREFELRIRRPDGELRTVLDTTYTIRDPGSGELFFHGILVDITARKELENQLREQNQRDPLTGCYNRRYLAELEQACAAGAVARWGCIYIDIDRFKRFNDLYGHEAGDLVLVKMGHFLMSQVRAEEAVVRLGGDEFAVILPEADEERTVKVAARLQIAALRRAPAAFSLGFATRENGERFERTLSRADRNLLAVRVIERAPEAERREE